MLLSAAPFVGTYITCEQYVMIGLTSGAYPYLIKGDAVPDISGACITGEIYEIDETCMVALDRLEGHPHMYRRQPVMVQGFGVAEAYILEDPTTIADILRGVGRRFRIIPSGDWAAV